MVPYIETRGSSEERGIQQGSILKDKIHKAIQDIFYSDFFKEMSPAGMPLEATRKALGLMAKRYLDGPIKKSLPNQYQKLHGIEKGAELSRAYTFICHFFEIVNGIPGFVYKNPPKELACSYIGVTDPATKNGEIIVGRNYDFPQILQPIQVLRKEFPDDGFKNIGFTQFPLIGSHIALNEKGLSIGLNYGRCWKKSDFKPKGVPSTIILQEAIEKCATTQEAIDFLTKFEFRANGAFYGLMDASGDSAVVETTHSRFAIRRPENGIIAHTNIYVSDNMKDANLPMDVRYKMAKLNFSPIESPIRRFKRLHILLKRVHGAIDMESIKKILTDHDPGAENEVGPNDFSICTDAEDAGTLASVLIFPKKKEFWVTDNRPCQTEYEKFVI